MKLPREHPSIPKPKVGVLLINLGTPNRTDYFSMRKYLNEFLSDKRVIEVPSIITFAAGRGTPASSVTFPLIVWLKAC